MKNNVEGLCSKIFKDREQVSIGEIRKIKQTILDEILFYKFHSHSLNMQGKMGPEEFCKSILSNLVPSDAFSKISQIDQFITSGKIKGQVSFQDFVTVNRFFNEYKRYFKLKKTSNFSRDKFKEVFQKFADDYSLQIDNIETVDSLFSLIDFDGNENLEYDEMKKFLFRLNTGGRCDKKNQNSGFKPWYDLKTKLGIYREKLKDIYDIIQR